MTCSCRKNCPDRKTMRDEHGTPDDFADSVWRAEAGLMVTHDEARAAIANYRAEYAAAPEGTKSNDGVAMTAFVLKSKKCDLYAAERSGSWCRWEPRIEDAIRMTRPEWDAVLAPDALVHLELVPLCTRCELKPASDDDLCSSCHDKLGAAQDARAAEGT